MGLTGSTGSVVTPGRTTKLLLDVPETVVREGYWGGARRGAEIAPLASKNQGKDSIATQNVRYWPSGVWTLRPYQESLSFIQEKLPQSLTADDFTYRPNGSGPPVGKLWLFSILMTEFAMWKAPFGVGYVHEPGVVTKGDKLYRASIGAGVSPTDASRRLPASPPAPQYAPTLGPGGWEEFGNPNVALDCVFYSGLNQRADQGYFLRWLTPGTTTSWPDVVMNFYFGQYCLVIGGDGDAQLVEWSREAGGAYRWTRRTSFRYARANQAANTLHTLVIFPHLGPHGEKYICFSGSAIEAAQHPGVITAGSAPPSVAIHTSEFLYRVDPLVRFQDVDEAGPAHVTREGPIRMDVRRDLRVGWHVSQLIFFNAGALTDSPWAAPVAATPNSTNPFRTQLYARVPDGHDAQISLRDGKTFSTTTIRLPLPQIRLTGDGDGPKGGSTDTPLLYGYRLYRPAVTETITPGRLEAAFRSAAWEAGGPDGPKGDRGNAQVEDVKGALAKVTNRGVLSAKLVMDVTPPGGGPAKKVTLFRGYAVRPRARRHPQAGKPYPSDNWRSLSLLLTGMGERLDEVSARVITYRHFAVDETAAPLPGGRKPAWKVTDALKFYAQQAGLPDSQILVEDLPVRFSPGLASNKGDLEYDPSASILEAMVRLARNYLGGYLVWDACAGPLDADGYPDGALRLVRPHEEGAASVASFVGGPTQPGLKVPVHPGAYAANETFIEGEDEEYVVPPEGNCLFVATCPPVQGTKGFRVENWAYNPKSYSVPGMSPADPNSPHYIGRQRMIVLIDPALAACGPDGGDKDALETTQRAVDLAVVRIFNYACRARRVKPIRAPLLLITDADTGRLRPLRFGDPVSVRGQSGWYVRSNNPLIDGINHLSSYELERLVPLTE